MFDLNPYTQFKKLGITYSRVSQLMQYFWLKMRQIWTIPTMTSSFVISITSYFALYCNFI